MLSMPTIDTSFLWATMNITHFQCSKSTLSSRFSSTTTSRYISNNTPCSDTTNALIHSQTIRKHISPIHHIASHTNASSTPIPIHPPIHTLHPLLHPPRLHTSLVAIPEMCSVDADDISAFAAGYTFSMLFVSSLIIFSIKVTWHPHRAHKNSAPRTCLRG